MHYQNIQKESLTTDTAYTYEFHAKYWNECIQSFNQENCKMFSYNSLKFQAEMRWSEAPGNPLQVKMAVFSIELLGMIRQEENVLRFYKY